jgi:hypothetical protein
MGRGCGGPALAPFENAPLRLLQPAQSERKSDANAKHASRHHATTALQRSRKNHATASRPHNACRPQCAFAKAADWRLAGVRVKYRAF